MSAAGRGAVRVEKDFYPTPAWCIKAISDRVEWHKVALACEPCVGSHAIPLACPHGVEWEWYEIREGRDYLAASPSKCDLTLTNPPYDIATEFLTQALKHSLCVAFLLRINYLGSADRFEFLTANPPSHLYVLSKRPSFVDVCKGFPETKTRKKIKGCGWAYQKVDQVKKCLGCGGNVGAATDATEYAWICWERGNVLKDKPGIHFLKGNIE